MSKAIRELGLDDEAPFTVHRTGSRFAPLWRASCSACDHTTAGRQLLSQALAAMKDHAELHRLHIWDRQLDLLESQRRAA